MRLNTIIVPANDKFHVLKVVERDIADGIHQVPIQVYTATRSEAVAFRYYLGGQYLTEIENMESTSDDGEIEYFDCDRILSQKAALLAAAEGVSFQEAYNVLQAIVEIIG